jgi:hypothetical protein
VTKCDWSVEGVDTVQSCPIRGEFLGGSVPLSKEIELPVGGIAVPFPEMTGDSFYRLKLFFTREPLSLAPAPPQLTSSLRLCFRTPASRPTSNSGTSTFTRACNSPSPLSALLLFGVRANISQRGFVARIDTPTLTGPFSVISFCLHGSASSFLEWMD